MWSRGASQGDNLAAFLAPKRRRLPACDATPCPYVGAWRRLEAPGGGHSGEQGGLRGGCQWP